MGKAIQKIKRNIDYALIVTHDPEFILECCDYVIELDKGSVKRSYRLDAMGQEILYDFLALADMIEPDALFTIRCAWEAGYCFEVSKEVAGPDRVAGKLKLSPIDKSRS